MKVFLSKLARPLAAAAAFACCAPAFSQNAVDVFAYFNFNDATTPAATRSAVGTFTGALENGAVYTADAGGRTAQAGDRAVDFGTTASAKTVRFTDIADALNAAAATDKASLSIWMKWAVTPVNNSLFWMVSPSSAGGSRGWQGHVPYGNGTIYFDTGGTTANSQRLQVAVPAGTDWLKWHHVAYIKNANVKQIWLDGKMIAQGTAAAPLVTDFTQIVLGQDFSNTANQFRGLIDDFALFTGALEQGPILALANGSSPLVVAELSKDNDNDGLPGWWEELYGLNINDPADASLDGDADGLTNLQEFQKGTNPRLADTDGDTLKDGVETGTGVWVSATDTGTNPLSNDSDGDLLKDNVETNTGVFASLTNTGTDPNNRDSDGDRIPDPAELSMGTNPADPSSTPTLPAGLNLLAFWNFNTATVASQALDSVHNYQAILENGAVYTADAGGRTGAAGDRGVTLGNASTAGRSVHIPAGAASTNITGLLSTAAAGDAMSVSIWQKWNGAIANSSAIWMVSPSTTNGGSRGFQAHLPYGNGTVYFDTGTDGAANYNRLSGGIAGLNDPSFTWEAWHHIVLVKNHDIKQIWIDGKLFLENNTLPLPGDFFEIFLGMDFSNTANTARIIMDDVAIYGSALDEAKILALKAGVNPADLDAAAGDTDNDGLPNFWEDLYGLNKTNPDDAALDSDSDGLTNLQEYAGRTLPKTADTDGDGLKDGAETKTGVWTSATDTGTDPLKADTDRDTIPDGAETHTGIFVNGTNTGTDPNTVDSDGDGYPDGVELQLASNPTLPTSVPVVAGERNLLALWDFNSAASATTSTDKIHNFVGSLTSGAVYTADAGGRTGAAGDLALNMGSTTVAGRGFKMSNAIWANAAAINDTITISFWQKWNVAIANSSTFWFFSPTAPNANRGAHAETPWGNGDIPWDTGGTTVGSQRIQVNFSTFTNVTTLSFFTNWHHFAFVKSGANKAVYIDGRLFNSGDAAAPMYTDLTDLYLGVEPTGANNMRGIIDDFAVYASALSEEQIGKLAQGASPITLEIPVTSFKFTGATYAAGAVSITWESQAGRSYKIFSSSDLATWSNVTTVTGAAGTTSYSPTLPAGSGMAFFRVQAL